MKVKEFRTIIEQFDPDLEIDGVILLNDGNCFFTANGLTAQYNENTFVHYGRDGVKIKQVKQKLTLLEKVACLNILAISVVVYITLILKLWKYIEPFITLGG